MENDGRLNGMRQTGGPPGDVRQPSKLRHGSISAIFLNDFDTTRSFRKFSTKLISQYFETCTFLTEMSGNSVEGAPSTFSGLEPSKQKRLPGGIASLDREKNPEQA